MSDILQSVIIPTGGDTLRLACVLRGLTFCDAHTGAYEVIVCGDVTKDGHKRVAELICSPEFGVLPIRFEHLSFKRSESDSRLSSVRNMGIAHAHGEQCIFLDEDCVPERDFLRAHARHANAKKPTAALGMRFLLHESRVPAFANMLAHIVGDKREDKREFDHFCFVETNSYAERDRRDRGQAVASPGYWFTCNASAPTEMLRKIGGFDKRFDGHWGYEDLDVATRLQIAGADFESLTGGAVVHLGHPSRTYEGYDDEPSAREAQNARRARAFNIERKAVLPSGAIVPAKERKAKPAKPAKPEATKHSEPEPEIAPVSKEDSGNADD